MTHLQQFQSKLRGTADAALICGENNRFYLCDFPYSDGYLLILPDAAYLITDFRYEEAARREASAEFTVLSPETGAFSEIGKRMEAHGATARLVEENHLTLALQARITEQFPTLRVLGGASAVLKELRVFKDEQELERIISIFDKLNQ